jgi:hypothetical protein
VIDKLVDGVTAKLQEAEHELAELRVQAVEHQSSKEPFAVLGALFADEVRSLVGDELPDAAAVRRAARLAVAEQAWEQRLGELLDTRDVIELLQVTRQRVSMLAKDDRLIALAQAGRLRFPAWQFAGTDGDDRACLGAAHRRLVDEGGMSPWSAASWFLTEHPDLEDRDPVAWLREGGDNHRVLLAAQRDAARAAQ